MSRRFYPPNEHRKPNKEGRMPAVAKPLHDQACSHIQIVLRCGSQFVVQIAGLEEDEDGVIYGKLLDGRNFALPADHVAYCVEQEQGD